MALFYTGRGDKGSSEVGQRKFPKDSPVLEALGDLDELNSLIGATRSKIRDEELKGKLRAVQEALFIIQARVAWIMFPEYEAKQFSEGKILELEKEIDEIEAHIQPERGFVIPGEDAVEASLDYIRAVARRAERSVYRAHKEHELPQEILTYMNRLSSYFFALARFEIYKKQIRESKPVYE